MFPGLAYQSQGLIGNIAWVLTVDVGEGWSLFCIPRGMVFLQLPNLVLSYNWQVPGLNTCPSSWDFFTKFLNMGFRYLWKTSSLPLLCGCYGAENNYLVHQVSKGGVQPSDSNLRAIAECTLPQTYTEIWAFLGLVGHYPQFIKGFECIPQLLNGLLSGEGASRKLKWVSLPKDALNTFDALEQACMSTPVLAFANYTKEFLLETNASNEGLGAVISQKQVDGWYHLIAYGSQALTAHEKTTIPSNLNSWC